MALYKNLTKDSPLAAVEFTPVSDGNFSFFYVDSPMKADAVKSWLASPDIKQEIIAETRVNGQPVLVTHGDRSKDELMSKLAEMGDKLQISHYKKTFPEKAWAIRGTTSMIGQGLQLTASMLRPNRKLDNSLFWFAVPNLIAGGLSVVYGAQRTEDVNRLRFLKEAFNDQLGNYLPGGNNLPSIEDHRSVLHQEPEAPKDLGQRFNDYMKRNSVRIGELGLRFIGAINMAFPYANWAVPSQWKAMEQKLQEGGPRQFYASARNAYNLSHLCGMLSLAGKTVALTSEAEDPYAPKEKTWLNTFREKVSFRLGGWMEAFAFGALAVDGLMNKKISFTKGGKEYRDWLSFAGGSLFTFGYIVRNWAKFGVKDMNMDELYAHVTDGLAKMPPDKLPQLMADTAASVKEHFKDKPMNFGEIFTRMMTDTYRYHHIALDNLGTEPGERLAKLQAPVASAIAAEEANAKTTQAPRALSDRVSRPASSHVQNVIQTNENKNTALGINV